MFFLNLGKNIRLLDRFKTYIAENGLFRPADTILAAVSGGIDSVVLIDLLVRSGYSCGVAHCNFNLRGEESDGDEKFVKELASGYDIPIFTRSFETSEYAETNKISIQMAARDLRYEWFEEVRSENSFDHIATAHNRNDVLETFFINLARGTGIHGLTGIKSRNGYIIRPLLFASRKEINDYAVSHSLEWHEDSSNPEVKYSRNKIRHQLMPLFDNLNPKFAQTMVENIQRLSETEEIFNQAIEKKKEELFSKEHGFITIQIDDIRTLSPLKTWLYELVKDYNFTPPVISDILDSFDSTSGRQFFSETHRIVKDRNKLIISSIRDSQSRKFYIEDPYREVSEPVQLEMDVLPATDKIEFLNDGSVAYFDLDLLDFPLVVRKWEQGDYFQPFGMQGIKKLSDYFIDLKLSIPEKENIWLLTSGGRIAWIMGYRTDDRFRISPLTMKILKISIKF